MWTRWRAMIPTLLSDIPNAVAYTRTKTTAIQKRRLRLYLHTNALILGQRYQAIAQRTTTSADARAAVTPPASQGNGRKSVLMGASQAALRPLSALPPRAESSARRSM